MVYTSQPQHMFCTSNKHVKLYSFDICVKVYILDGQTSVYNLPIIIVEIYNRSGVGQWGSPRSY